MTEESKEIGTLVLSIANMTLDELRPLKAQLEEHLRVVNMLIACKSRKDRSEKRKPVGRPKGSRNKAPVENGEAVPA